MKKLLENKRGKKGFTLAELLIVVAIIAILVAIAAPIFFGALEEARKATYDANVRAVRAVGVNEILQNYEEKNYDDTKYSANGWYVTATVTENGDITVDSVSETGTPTTYDTYKAAGDNDEHEITVQLKPTEVA